MARHTASAGPSSGSEVYLLGKPHSYESPDGRVDHRDLDAPRRRADTDVS